MEADGLKFAVMGLTHRDGGPHSTTVSAISSGLLPPFFPVFSNAGVNRIGIYRSRSVCDTERADSW